MDTTLLITIVPPVFAGVVAYAIARRKATIQEARISATAQHSAMTTAMELVTRESLIMRTELRRELDELRNENRILKIEVDNFRNKLNASDELIGTLRSEIIALRKTIELYECQINDLKKK